MGKAFNPRRSNFTKNELISGDIPINASSYTQIGVYTILAGVARALGFGMLSGQDSSEGRIFMALKTAADADINGTIRIELRDPEDVPIKTLYEARTETLRTSETDRTVQVPFNERPEIIGEDYKLAVLVKGDAAVTVAKANSTILMDTTTYSVR
jgi:hypothetical protein